MDTVRHADIARADGVVLSAQRDDDAFAVHAEFRRGMNRARASILAPNAITEAAREIGSDGRTRVAGLCAGRSARRPEDRAMGCRGGSRRRGRGFAEGPIARARAIARDRATHSRRPPRSSTACDVTQRPTFVLDTEIGDRAVFAGFAKAAPIAATIDAMLDDARLPTRRTRAHFGQPPARRTSADAATRLQIQFASDAEIRLATLRCCTQLPFGWRMSPAGRRDPRSRGEAGVFAQRPNRHAGRCDEDENGEVVHSPSAGLELDLTCKNKFV